MKAKLKKLLLVLCMVTCVFALSACGQTDENTSEGYESEDYAKICAYDVVQYLINGNLTVDVAEQNEVFDESIEEEEIKAFIETFDKFKEEVGGVKFNSESAYSAVVELYSAATNGEITESQLLAGYIEAYETAGLKTKEITYGDNQTIVISLEGNERNATVEVSLNKKAQVVNITPTAKYTTKEKVVKALMNTLMGMGTVFIVLILISLIIKAFAIIPMIMDKKKKKEEVPVIKEAKVPVPVAKTEVSKTNTSAATNEMNDSELVAVITAAILASSTCNATSADQLIVRSIKKVKRK
ncbi:MAG: OadG family protein [Lachnospiraceae bacterium]|nr:OadG family protein [Lachnospiraceae bacterium]